MRGQLPGDKEINKSHISGKDVGPLKSRLDPSFFVTKKAYCCICEHEFDSESLMSGKAQSDGFDIDLRPRYKNIDLVLYRVIRCPQCGYSNIDKFFSYLSKTERSMLSKDMIPGFDEETPSFSNRDYENVYPLYRSALRNALSSGMKVSKRAYIALYTAWLLRGWREEKELLEETVKPEDPMSPEAEKKLLSYALKNFSDAAINEDFPICGIDEPTFYYLIAALSHMTGNDKQAYDYTRMSLRCDPPPTVMIRTKAEDLQMVMRKKI